jgi:shikimate kinase
MSVDSTPSREAENIVLIGMPGAGKSTLGVLLAKTLGLDFVDTDILIQRRAGATLATYMQAQGYLALRNLEALVIRELDVRKTVIATGGSAVYSAEAMAHLGRSGVIVYLHCPMQALAPRIANLAQRGIAAPADQSLEEIEAERVPLYERFADITLDLQGLDSRHALEALIQVI